MKTLNKILAVLMVLFVAATFTSCSKQETKTAESTAAAPAKTESTSAPAKAAEPAKPVLKEEILTKDTFTGDWLNGTWDMTIDTPDVKNQLSFVIDGDKATNNGDTISLDELKTAIFDGFLSEVSDETIALLKEAGATVEGDGKFRVNAERNEIKSELTATLGEESVYFAIVMKKQK